MPTQERSLTFYQFIVYTGSAHNEMGWTVNFFAHKASTWHHWADKARLDLRFGHECYAMKQRAFWLSMKDNALRFFQRAILTVNKGEPVGDIPGLDPRHSNVLSAGPGDRHASGSQSTGSDSGAEDSGGSKSSAVGISADDSGADESGAPAVGSDGTEVHSGEDISDGASTTGSEAESDVKSDIESEAESAAGSDAGADTDSA